MRFWINCIHKVMNPLTMGNELKGARILITRPTHQASALTQAIREHGGTPIIFPLFEIQPTRKPEQAKALLLDFMQADKVIFVSANAVREAQDYLPTNWREHQAIAVIGGGTARALEQFNASPSLMPEQGFDSEGLLALPGLQSIEGETILIVRGEGGRELLPRELEQRGAKVVIAEVYKRVGMEHNIAQLLGDAEHHELDMMTFTSGDAMQHMLQFCTVFPRC